MIAITTMVRIIYKTRFSILGSTVDQGFLNYGLVHFFMFFGVLELDFGNQIWKFLCRYFGIFSGNFSLFLDSAFSIELKLDFSRLSPKFHKM